MSVRFRQLSLGLLMPVVACHNRLPVASNVATSSETSAQVRVTETVTTVFPGTQEMHTVNISDIRLLVGETSLDGAECRFDRGPLNVPEITRTVLLEKRGNHGDWRYLMLSYNAAGQLVEYRDGRGNVRQVGGVRWGWSADSISTQISLDFPHDGGFVNNAPWQAPLEVARSDTMAILRDPRFGRIRENIKLVRDKCEK